MKKNILILFFIMCITTIANDFNKIDTFNLTIKEKRVINNTEKEKIYSLKSILPNIIIQEIMSPKINKGEKHIYKDNEKTTYIPMFNQKNTEKYNDEEFYIIKLIKDMKNINIEECEGNICKINDKIIKINPETLDIDEIIYSENEKIVFSNYEITESGIIFPFLIQIYDGNNIISELVIEEAFINVEIDEKDYNI
ncbi:MAG: hypothetical protein GX287_03310 [Fusobacteria bacterium]|nr:hypothetical protein [Fusobacteriota bacterium]